MSRMRPGSTGERTAASAMPLLQAAHPGPAAAVTTVVALLAVGQHLPAPRGWTVTAAVLAGQLTIGWGNDLLDAGRDRAAGRHEKPLAFGPLTAHTVRLALTVAAIACVVLSLAVGWRSALVHLGVGVVSGHLYNAWLKATPWSWLPYLLAFGTLPAVVSLAGVPPQWPPAWMLGTAASLGVAAHLLNTLPDLEADVALGVRGLPHRIGARASRVVATMLLVTGSVLAVVGSPGLRGVWAAVALVLVLGLATVALVGRQRAPFVAAIGIALVDVVLLTVAGGS